MRLDFSGKGTFLNSIMQWPHIRAIYGGRDREQPDIGRLRSVPCRTEMALASHRQYWTVCLVGIWKEALDGMRVLNLNGLRKHRLRRKQAMHSSEYSTHTWTRACGRATTMHTASYVCGVRDNRHYLLSKLPHGCRSKILTTPGCSN